jgi:hypothetical protein
MGKTFRNKFLLSSSRFYHEVGEALSSENLQQLTRLHDVRFQKTASFITAGSVYAYIIAFNTRNAVTQWLRHCATNRKVAGSIPDGVIGIFH